MGVIGNKKCCHVVHKSQDLCEVHGIEVEQMPALRKANHQCDCVVLSWRHYPIEDVRWDVLKKKSMTHKRSLG